MPSDPAIGDLPAGNGVAGTPAAPAAAERLREPSFVGRDTELAAFQRTLEWAEASWGDVVLVEAKSGGGKTRLLDQMAALGAQRGSWVLRGRASNGEAQRPFELLDGVTRELLVAVRGDAALARDLRARLGPECQAVCAALPELQEVLGIVEPERLGPEAYGVARTLRALSALLDALGTADRPALLLLDDCQWAGELSLQLFSSWRKRRQERTTPCHTLLVLAFRAEDVDPGHALRTLPAILHLTLAPLGRRELRQLFESMAGPLPDACVDAVARASEGSPFFARALLQGLVEMGALVYGPTGWEVVESALDKLRLSERAAEVVMRRLELLPRDVLNLLSAGAVLGRDFDLEVASLVAGQTPRQSAEALAEAQQRHLILATSGSRCSLLHDKIRDWLLQRLPAGERAELHAQAARWLTERTRENDVDLAYHHNAAGQAARALPHALRAAEQARSRHSLEVAERNYRIAERSAGGADHATRLRIAEGLGDVLLLRGHYAESVEKLEEARQFASDAVAQAALELKFGELEFKQGRSQEGAGHLERGLSLLGKRVYGRGYPRLALLWMRFRRTLRDLFHKNAAPEGGAALVAERLYERLSYAYFFFRGAAAAEATALCASREAERSGSPSATARTLALRAYFLGARGKLPAAQALLERALVLARASSDRWSEGHAFLLGGMGHVACAHNRRGVELLRQAVPLLDRTGDRWELIEASSQLLIGEYWMGELRLVQEKAEAVHRGAREIGHAHAISVSLACWSLASGGKPPLLALAQALSEPGDPLTRTGLLIAEGVRLLRAGTPELAALRLQEADVQVKKGKLEQEAPASVPTLLATALRLAWEKEIRARGEKPRGPLPPAVVVHCRRGMRLGRRFPNVMSAALREAGIVAAYSRQPLRARRLLDASVALASRLQQRYSLAQSLYARAQVGRVLGWPSAVSDRDEARAKLQELGVEVVPSTPPATTVLAPG